MCSYVAVFSGISLTFFVQYILTSDLEVEELALKADVILIQEHWFFDCKLIILNEISNIRILWNRESNRY